MESSEFVLEDLSDPKKSLKTCDSLKEQLDDSDTPCDHDTLAQILEELVCTGYLEEKINDEDNIYYTGKHGLSFENFRDISDPIKKFILSLFTPNPKGFFIQLNTQKGKTAHTLKEIKEWFGNKDKKNIGFLICDNDQTLTDQFQKKLEEQFGTDIELIVLSAKSKKSHVDLADKIDSYINYKKNPILIVLLANNIQCGKMVKLLYHIHDRFINDNANVSYSLIFDEADKTYPLLRDQLFTMVDGSQASLKTYILDKSEALNRIGWISATDGQLLDEKYDEVANAHSHKVVIDENDSLNYRAMHHPEAVIHLEKYNRSNNNNNNKYAENIITKYYDTHFKNPIQLPSGESYYRKIIINSSAKQIEMEKIAKFCNKKGMYAIVFNGFRGCSIKIYKDEKLFKVYKTNGKEFNKVLVFAYKHLKLSDKPLIIVGRRKVDRGLGFHFAPRDKKTVVIDSPEASSTDKVILENGEGLIWTDMILGYIPDVNIAVQKAGRLSGIIAQCPQYCGKLHYWTDEVTAMLVKNQLKIVDQINTLPGMATSLQAATRAKENISNDLEKPASKSVKVIDHDLYRLYKTSEDFRSALKALGYRTGLNENNKDENGFVQTSFNKTSGVYDVDFIIRNAELAQKQGGGKAGSEGKGASRTTYPCYDNINDNTTLIYAIIIKDKEDLKKLPASLKDVKVALNETDGKYHIINSNPVNDIIRSL